MAQQAENGRKINNKLSQPRTHKTITKKKRPPSTNIPEGLLSKGLNKEFKMSIKKPKELSRLVASSFSPKASLFSL